MNATPVAIVGVGSLFPGARDKAEFWRNLVAGVDGITDVPDTHWRIEDYYDPDPAVPDKTYCRRGGFIPAVPFDPMEFGIPPNTLEVTDILQLLSLLVARDTLADVANGHDPARTGVVLGVTGANSLTQPLSARLQTPVLREVVRSMGLSEEDTDEVARRFVAAFAPWEENSFPGMLGNVVAGRIANRFDLGGMNCTVDAACASSLAAVNNAVNELAAGRADLMLTGGCDAENTIFMYLCFSKTPAFSKSGVIRPFDRESDGTLIGEGIGMLALKRLVDAERDGDRIYAVIRGTGIASDGRHKSIYAPRREGQQLALRRAYAESDVEPGDIGLLECHGTGTAVGDRTELTALTDVYREAGVAPGSVAVGSVKSQIGHTKAAAGAASLIKVALSLYHKVLPPTININAPTDALDDSPFHVAANARPWITDPARERRMAAVSSFGFGGTNFHCVVAEADQDSAAPSAHDVASVRVWHAQDPAALLAALRAGEPGADPDEPVPAGHARLAVVSAPGADEAEVLREAVDRLAADPEEFETPGGACYRRRAADHGKVALLCAGQGSQYPGMGRTAAMAVDPVRAALDRAAAHFTGTPTLGQIIYPPTAFDDVTARAQEDTLRRTENAQPAIGALAAGHLHYLRALGLRADGVLGHSFGELTALWAAGSLDEADFHALARARGVAMAEAVEEGGDPGAMLAVSASADRVTELLTGHADVHVCNVNAPNQTVVGGGTDAVVAFADVLAAADVSARRLDVAAAFHTPIVSGAEASFREAVTRVTLAEPRLTVYPNTTGVAYGQDPEHNAEVLAGQLARPVHFADRLAQMYDDGYRTFVEIGPRRVLSGLTRQTLGRVFTIAADGGPAADADTELKLAAARLLVLGLPLTGLNRFIAPPRPAAEPAAHAIQLTGVNHVSERRRAAYRDALAAGPTTTEREPAVTEPEPSRPAEQAQYPVEPLYQHLSTHDEFLRSQLGVAERLAGLLERDAGNGAVDPNLAAGIGSITEQSVAVSHSHAHANEVLRGLAELTAGVQPTPVPSERLEPYRALPPGHTDGNGDAATALTNGNGHAQPNGNGHSAMENGHAAADGDGARTVQDGVEFELAAPATPAPPAPREAVEAPATVAETPPETDASGESPRDIVLALVAEKTGYPPEMLDPAMNMEADLGIDSIKRVELLSDLQARSPGGEVEPPEPGSVRTLTDLIEFVEQARGVVADPKVREGAAAVETAGVRPVALPEPETAAAPYGTRTAALAGHGELVTAFADLLREHGWSVHHDDSRRADLVVSFADDTTAPTATLRDTLLLAGRVLPGLRAADGRAGFVTVTRIDGVGGLSGETGAPSAVGGLAGLVRTVAAEAPEVFCRQVDLHPALAADVAARLLLAEVLDADPAAREVGWSRERARTGVALCAETAGPSVTSPPNAGDLFVVSGGARGVTAACAVGLARRYGTGLVLLGRTEPRQEPEALHDIPDDGLRKALIARGARRTPKEIEAELRALLAGREIRRTVAAITDAGAEAHYLAVDVTDRAATARALHPYRDRITGIVHGAGTLADAHLEDKRAAAVDQVLAVKLRGFDALLDAVPPERLRHVVTFSSVAGLFGNQGQADYAMANAALDRRVCALRHEAPTIAAHSLVWGAWEGGMVTPELARMFTARGVRLVPMEEGVRRFVAHFEPDVRHDTVRFIGPPDPLSGPPDPLSGPPHRPATSDITAD